MSTESRLRKRIPKSCRRCHRRKQRCVGYPTCANCESANVQCTRAETVASWHHAMSKGALAQRIEMLEAQLSELKQASSPASSSGTDCESQHPSRASAGACSRKGSVGGGGIASPFVSWMNEGTDAQSPSYLGPSSGMAIAENLGRVVHDVVWTKSIPVDPCSQSSDQNEQTQDRLQSATLPEEEDGLRLLSAYFDGMHIRLPFLDRAEIVNLHTNRHRLSIDTTDSHAQVQFSQFKLYMVYAIGASILQMTETAQAKNTTPSSALFTTALRFESCLHNAPSLATVEAMMLVVLYHLRSSITSNVWYILGTAMRICVDFGLHRRSHYTKLTSSSSSSSSSNEAQHHSRLFWSVYLIERYLSWSLGRPFSIPESQIDADIPSSPSSISSPEGSDIRRFIACIQLQRITSLINNRIYTLDANGNPLSLLPEVHPLLSALEHYHAQTLPSLHLGATDTEFIIMHWNNSIRVLLQPFVGILSPSDPLLQTCLSASGRMCQSFKKLSQRDDASGYSFLLANSIFMAGMTICFCLFRAPQLWTTTTSNDLRACSSAIFMMAEQNPRLKKCRDSLEAIITRMMDFVNENLSRVSGDIIPNPIPGPSSGPESNTQWLYSPASDQAFPASMDSLFMENIWDEDFSMESITDSYGFMWSSI